MGRAASGCIDTTADHALDIVGGNISGQLAQPPAGGGGNRADQRRGALAARGEEAQIHAHRCGQYPRVWPGGRCEAAQQHVPDQCRVVPPRVGAEFPPHPRDPPEMSDDCRFADAAMAPEPLAECFQILTDGLIPGRRYGARHHSPSGKESRERLDGVDVARTAEALAQALERPWTDAVMCDETGHPRIQPHRGSNAIDIEAATLPRRRTGHTPASSAFKPVADYPGRWPTHRRGRRMPSVEHRLDRTESGRRLEDTQSSAASPPDSHVRFRHAPRIAAQDSGPP